MAKKKATPVAKAIIKTTVKIRKPAKRELPRLGAHESIAGGVDKAIDRAREAGCTALQIFLKNNNQWKGSPLKPEIIERYRAEVAKGDLGLPFAHASYLVNLASTNPDFVEKSIENLADDLERARILGVPGIVMHPGAHMGAGEEAGIRQIAAQLNRLFKLTPGNPAQIWLEGTAGQGSALGYKFEHLRDIIDLVKDKKRLGVCLDTCHVFAAGYDIRTSKAAKAMLDEFDRVVGLEWLRAFHFNDSKKGLGSRVDRHEHIGKGLIGEEGFAALLKDKRILHVPRVLETPKGDDLAEDKMNLATLRRLALS